MADSSDDSEYDSQHDLSGEECSDDEDDLDPMPPVVLAAQSAARECEEVGPKPVSRKP
jgi:hypothetical protein